MTTLQIVSDIHLEHRPKRDPFVIEPVAKNLALLGDIGKPFTIPYRDFLATQSDAFEKVFVLIGNHEKYEPRRWASAVDAEARRVCSLFPNVHLLERDAFQLTEKTTLLGCTLWSNIDEFTSTALNDFRLIQADEDKGPLTRDTYLSWHKRDSEWLQREIASVATEGCKAVILTHHGPHPAMSGHYVGSPICSGFVTDLTHLLKPPVVAWASGHVHSNVDFGHRVRAEGVETTIRCVSNAVGYPREGSRVGYKKDVVLEIE